MNAVIYERRDWSRLEVEATVASYFEMLDLEVRGNAYNKSAYRRTLLTVLDNRTPGAVERKHQNISAILIELGLPYIAGYKPLFNYQDLLSEIVEERVTRSPALVATIESQVMEVPDAPTVDDILALLVERPQRLEKRQATKVREPRPRKLKTDYLALEGANAALGRSGELLVYRFEKARLIAANKEALAEQVEHIAISRGDGFGYDIASYETSGRERLIEVKTTNYGEYTPFYITSNEVEVSKTRANTYWLCRVFNFRRDPKLFMLPGAVPDNCSLDPSQYVGRIA